MMTKTPRNFFIRKSVSFSLPAMLFPLTQLIPNSLGANHVSNLQTHTFKHTHLQTQIQSNTVIQLHTITAHIRPGVPDNLTKGSNKTTRSFAFPVPKTAISLKSSPIFSICYSLSMHGLAALASACPARFHLAFPKNRKLTFHYFG